MSDLIDIVQFIKKTTSRPRGRACAILTSDYNDQDRWSARLAEKTEAEHINLLDLFNNDAALADTVSRYTVEIFFKFLKNRSTKDVLIVSGMEFLKAVWSGYPDSTRSFATQLSTWVNTPCLVFVLQYDSALATYDFGRRYTYTYIIDQRETLAI